MANPFKETGWYWVLVTETGDSVALAKQTKLNDPCLKDFMPMERFFAFNQKSAEKKFKRLYGY